jgi:hypothetical protein
MKDNDEDINQFEEMPLFTNPINIKHIEKNFDKNLLLYIAGLFFLRWLHDVFFFHALNGVTFFSIALGGRLGSFSRC